jgi:hypothetical protein
MRQTSLVLSILSLGSALVASCSAIVQPDPGRLGGTDAGGLDGGGRDGGGIDGGGRDGGELDVPVLPDTPADGGPVCITSCDDGVDCTVDTCQLGSCVNTPNEMRCAADERCSPTMGCVPDGCRTAADCDDRLFCNGSERCMVGGPGGGCMPGTPVDCTDGFACTVDACDEGRDACSNTPMDAACGDGVDCTVDRCAPGAGTSDGCTHAGNDALCGGLFCVVGSTCSPTGCTMGTPRACADASACTTDSCSEAMDMCVFAPRDDDMDGAPAASAPTSPGGPIVTCPGGTDCNDFNPAVRPGVTELCNGVDDNCNAMVDEGCAPRLPDDCSTARVITASGTGTFSLPMPLPTFGALRDDYDSNPLCPAGDTLGRDAVYAIDIVGRRDVVIDTIGSTGDTILDVAFTCDAASFTGQSVCSDDFAGSGGGIASRVFLHRVGATGVTTRVYVLVDAYRGSDTGAYQLNVRWGDAAGDGCVTATPMDITGGGTVLGFVTNTSSFQSGSCGSATPEAVLRFTGPASANVRLTTYSTTFGPDVYLRTACTSGELACVNSTPLGGGVEQAVLRTGVTSGTTHYFFVDGGATGSAYAVYYEPF